MVKQWAGRLAVLTACAVLLGLLPGCLYPEDHTPGSRASAHGTVLTVQDAVTRYQEATGLLPMTSADASVPAYEKFRIDFAKMKRMGYVEDIPKLAFENGGAYVFLIQDEETKPRVKLLDLAVFQAIDGVQKKVKEYRAVSGGNNPDGEEAYPGFRYVDFGKLGIKRPEIRSMFSHRPLELMTDDAGTVYADYGIDITEALKKAEAPPTTAEDMRARLVDSSDFVPVKSPVYRWVNNEPQAVAPAAGQ